VHGSKLEFFRVEHGDDEVADEKNRDDADEDGFHGNVDSECVTKEGVSHAKGEETDGCCNEDEVGHGGIG
jgi:hypothetical protein